MPPPLSHYCLEGEGLGEDEKVGEYCGKFGNGLLGFSGNDELRVSHVWEERGIFRTWPQLSLLFSSSSLLTAIQNGEF